LTPVESPQFLYISSRPEKSTSSGISKSNDVQFSPHARCGSPREDSHV
jgi:hypothetical protein